MDDERKNADNERIYKKWLSCGYTGEMKLDRFGNCVNEINKENNVKEIVIFDIPRYHAVLEYMQFPNGKWTSGSSVMFPLYGWSHGVSIWNTQYDTKEDAILEELRKIESRIESKDKKKAILDAIQECRNRYKKPSFEVVFNPMASFEQVALF